MPRRARKINSLFIYVVHLSPSLINGIEFFFMNMQRKQVFTRTFRVILIVFIIVIMSPLETVEFEFKFKSATFRDAI